jgi:hypothetical protein
MTTKKKVTDPTIKRILSGKGGAGSWHKQHASRQSSQPLYTEEQWAARRAERAAKQAAAAQAEPIDFEERAFNAVKSGVFILDFINEFEHSGDRERARYEFKRAQAILRETLPHLFS